MKKKLNFLCLLLIAGAILFQSCKKEETNLPLQVGIFYSVVDKQAAFTALTIQVEQWNWDFGDGTTSTEKNPVHIYANGGYYTVTLTGMDASGNSEVATSEVAVALTPYVLLTGGATNTKGKTWKLSSTHSPKDILANSDAKLSLFDPGIESLPPGTFSQYLGLPETYNDEFTFHFDGSYTQDTKDGTACGGIVYAMVMQQLGYTTITKSGGAAVFGQDAFALTKYTPDAKATFVFNEKEDFTIPTAPDFATAIQPPGIPVVTYPGVMTIDFPNSTEFIGLRDFQRKVIVQEINDNTMRLVIFLTMSPDAIVSQDPLIVLSTNAMVLTFEVVK